MQEGCVVCEEITEDFEVCNECGGSVCPDHIVGVEGDIWCESCANAVNFVEGTIHILVTASRREAFYAAIDNVCREFKAGKFETNFDYS